MKLNKGIGDSVSVPLVKGDMKAYLATISTVYGVPYRCHGDSARVVLAETHIGADLRSREPLA